MPTTSTARPAAAIPLPEVDSPEPVVVIPVASVAPLDGAPDGERINTFTLAPKRRRWSLAGLGTDTIDDVRDHARSRPLASVAAAFALGLLVARVLR